MAARMRDLASRLAKKVQGNFASTKGNVTNYVIGAWSKLSQENRSMLKQSCLNLSVPAAYTGVAWLAETGAGMIKPEEECAEIQALKVDFDQKVVHLFSNLDKLKDEKEKLKSEVLRLEGKVTEKENEVQMLRTLLAGQMGRIGALWMKSFMKHLSHSSPLPYYDSPESIGLIYWNPN